MYRSWVPAWGVAAVILAGFTYYSAGSLTHGFLTAYAASKLLVAGNLGPNAYDDRWFGVSTPLRRLAPLGGLRETTHYIPITTQSLVTPGPHGATMPALGG